MTTATTKTDVLIISFLRFVESSQFKIESGLYDTQSIWDATIDLIHGYKALMKQFLHNTTLHTADAPSKVFILKEANRLLKLLDTL